MILMKEKSVSEKNTVDYQTCINTDNINKENKKNANKKFAADRILSYFKEEWKVLLIITVSGLIYNFGLLLGPWFEGKMTGCLIDILSQNAVYKDMFILVVCANLNLGHRAH